MDSMSYRNNRPPQSRGEAEAAPVTSAQAGSASVPRTKSSRQPVKSRRPLVVIAAIVVIVVLLLAGWFFFGRGTTSGIIDSSKYQAVFFTNDQVYFGKLSQINDEYMSLKDIYYLQSKTTSDKTSPQTATQSDVTLIKLGNEIHGPEDQMIIPKDQIRFFENLKPQGTVSKSILSQQKK
jgi:hypothetical protein